MPLYYYQIHGLRKESSHLLYCMTAVSHWCFPCHFTEYRLEVTLKRKIKHRSYLTEMMIGKLKQLFCGENLFLLNVVNYPDSKELKLVTHLYGPNVITR